MFRAFTRINDMETMKPKSVNALPRTWAIVFFLFAFLYGQAQTSQPPNIIVIFADDLGYGDIGAFGNPSIRTPNIDRMAMEGQKWTSFYVAAPVCTPSRAGLLTGRYPVRSGMASNQPRVLFPNSKGGLPQSEITIANMLKGAGYYTACIGKWHLGHLPEYLPMAHGFDDYFGIPYSNDMNYVGKRKNYDAKFADPKSEEFNVPLMQNGAIIEQPAQQETLTKRYTEKTVDIIRKHQNGEEPFFVYLAYAMPHVPLFRSPDFEGVSRRGAYGDVVEEIDWSVGEIMKALEANGMDKNTLVVFTSDNGPWLTFKEAGGSAGPLSGGKGGTLEGGLRVPTAFWWPGKLKPGTVVDMGSTLDLFPTVAKLAGVELPADREYDGYDLSATLFGTGGKHPRNAFIYYRGATVYAVRVGPYKAHFTTKEDYGNDKPLAHDPPLLYQLDVDPAEKRDVAGQHQTIIAEIKKVKETHEKSIVKVENQLEKR